ncbi:MAG TPA: hypothetical protein VFW85_07615 [Gaiellaceae bacterium]|nr:hypothetical protein [Gaiellaceae bacterium]
MALSSKQADRFAARLDVDLDGVCLLCLSFITSAIHDGDPKEARRWVRRMAPSLWEDGLEQTILDAVGLAVARGDPDAEAWLAEVEQRGPKGLLVRAVVARLAEQLAAWERRSREASLN